MGTDRSLGRCFLGPLPRCDRASIQNYTSYFDAWRAPELRHGLRKEVA